MIKLINEDCLKALKNIEDNSIDLVLIDPPYNIGKDKWDKWKTVELYVDFMKEVFLELQRVLKDNGSFYFFHNDFLQIVEIQNMINKETNFKFKQFITWNKYFNDCNLEGYLKGHLSVSGLRNYKQMAEYALFYTFQDESGLNKIQPLCFSKYLDYMTKEKEESGLSLKEFNKITGYKSIASHWFYKNGTREQKQPRFIQKKDYVKLQDKTGFFNKEYEVLREEYESLRYTFNNQKTHHSVWNYNISSKEETGGHLTPKPIDLLENIILHSSNKNDVVLDCFMGSGSTGVACKNLNRSFIGIEIDEEYYKISKRRIENK